MHFKWKHKLCLRFFQILDKIQEFFSAFLSSFFVATFFKQKVFAFILFGRFVQQHFYYNTYIAFSDHFKYSDAGRSKILGLLVVKGGQNLPPLVVIGLTDLQNMGGRGHCLPPSSVITEIIFPNGVQ